MGDSNFQCWSTRTIFSNQLLQEEKAMNETISGQAAIIGEGHDLTEAYELFSDTVNGSANTTGGGDGGGGGGGAKPKPKPKPKKTRKKPRKR